MAEPQLYVGYSQNDFFYVNAGNNYVPSDSTCQDPSGNVNLPYINRNTCVPTSSTGLPTIDTSGCYVPDSNGNVPSIDAIKSCIGNTLTISGNIASPTDDNINEIFWKDNNMNCIKHEYCQNKKNAKDINSLETNHLGSGENLSNTNTFYINEYFRLISLFTASIILGNFIMKKIIP
jgi:hypothetical protein